MPHSAVSDLALSCLLVSHKKGCIWVKECDKLNFIGKMGESELNYLEKFFLLSQPNHML